MLLKFAPDVPYVAYQIRGSFAIEADAPPSVVRRAGYECGRSFISQLARQGYELRGGLHFDPTPRPHYDVRDMPARNVQDQHDPMDYIQTPSQGRVDYRFWGTFIRKQIKEGV